MNIWEMLAAVAAALVSGSGIGAWLSRGKTRAEVESVTVRTMRDVLAEVRTEVQALALKVDELELERDRLIERIKHLESRERMMFSNLAAHGQWDLLVLAEVRKHAPDFPDPPILDIDRSS